MTFFKDLNLKKNNFEMANQNISVYNSFTKVAVKKIFSILWRLLQFFVICTLRKRNTEYSLLN